MVAPWASPSRLGNASAWIETNSAADWVRAIFTRSASGMKVSSVRVMTTRYLPDFSIRSRNANPNPSTRLFSLSLPAWVPLSMPPWPGSITTTGRESAAVAGVGVGNCRPQFGPAFRRKGLNEGGAIDLFQLEHQPWRLAVGRLEHIGVCD